MPNTKRNTFLFASLFMGLLLLFFTNISLGSVTIPFKEVFNSLTGGHVSKQAWEYIIINYRLPKAITAIVTGMGLATSGLLMQTLFRNPLAGPDVLGLSSGASLGVAFVILGAGFLPAFLSDIVLSSYGIVLASTAGSFVVLLLVLFVSQKLRDTIAILIVGLMFGSFTSAFVGVLVVGKFGQFTMAIHRNTVSLRWIRTIDEYFQHKTTKRIIIRRKLCPKPRNEFPENPFDYHISYQYFSRKHYCICRANCVYRNCCSAYCETVVSNK